MTPWTIRPWNSPGQNTRVGSHCLLQGIFPTQGSNPGLPHCRWILYQLSHQGSIRNLYVKGNLYKCQFFWGLSCKLSQTCSAIWNIPLFTKTSPWAPMQFLTFSPPDPQIPHCCLSLLTMYTLITSYLFLQVLFPMLSHLFNQTFSLSWHQLQSPLLLTSISPPTLLPILMLLNPLFTLKLSSAYFLALQHPGHPPGPSLSSWLDISLVSRQVSPACPSLLLPDKPSSEA